MATSSPFTSKNRFEVMETDEDSDLAAQFTEYHSRHSKRRRLPASSPRQQQRTVDIRQQSQRQQQQQRGREADLYRQHQQNTDQHPNQKRRQAGGRLMKGSASGVRGLAAAKYRLSSVLIMSTRP